MLVEIAKGPRKAPNDLVSLLLECHERIRRLARLACQVGERSSLPDAERIECCERLTRYFGEALPLHVVDEEESITPRLRGIDAELDEALSTMAQQHAEHQPQLEALLAVTARLREAPSDAAARVSLAEVAATVERDLVAHLEHEEAVIIPAIRRHLSVDVQALIVDEMRGRRTPAG
jgi:iron-sulfur cluster repair protein YtfE (RIC family)